MYPFTDDSPIDDWFLDVNRNDYYGVTGAQFDLRSSPFLRHLDTPQQQLTLNVVGSGSADVESDVPGVSCTSTCTVLWDGGSSFQLSESVGTKTRFVGWSGACAGDLTTCDVTMDAPKTITATFAFQLPLTVEIHAETGSGSVLSVPDNLNCPTTCSSDFDQSSKVTLEARPGSGSRLEAWGGACSGRGACVVTMDQAKTVTATFGRATRVLRAGVSGKGTVTSSPRGIACPGKCVGTFGVESTVRLTAKPAKGYRLSRWTGACSGRAVCAVAMSSDESVRAVFAKQ
jgi:hypothetical protein